MFRRSYLAVIICVVMVNGCSHQQIALDHTHEKESGALKNINASAGRIVSDTRPGISDNFGLTQLALTETTQGKSDETDIMSQLIDLVLDAKDSGTKSDIKSALVEVPKKALAKVSGKKEIPPLVDLVSQIANAKLKGDSKALLGLYAKICKNYKTSNLASIAYFNRGLLYEHSHQFTAAIRVFTKVVKRYPESLQFAQAVERCFHIAKKLQQGVRPHYFGTIPGLRDRTSAIKNYELVVSYAPYSCYAPDALIETANLQIRAKHYDLAVDALERLIDMYPDSTKVAYAYLKIAEIYSSLVKSDAHNQGGAIKGLRYYYEFCLLFPYHEEIAFAKQKIRDLEESITRSKVAIGDFYFNTRYNENAAKMCYRSAIDYAPDTSGAKIGQEKIDQINLGAKPKSTPVDFLFPSYKPQNEIANALAKDHDSKSDDVPSEPEAITPSSVN